MATRPHLPAAAGVLAFAACLAACAGGSSSPDPGTIAGPDVTADADATPETGGEDVPSDTGGADDTALAELPPYKGRIVVTPGALLFTKSGDTATLVAKALDADGHSVDTPFTFTSSRPGPWSTTWSRGLSRSRSPRTRCGPSRSVRARRDGAGPRT